MQEIIREEIDLSLVESEIVEIQEGMSKVKNFYIGPFLQAEDYKEFEHNIKKEIENKMKTYLSGFNDYLQKPHLFYSR